MAPGDEIVENESDCGKEDKEDPNEELDIPAGDTWDGEDVENHAGNGGEKGGQSDLVDRMGFVF